ncbi:MAG: hypothetical protein VKK07_03235 [Merismopediaceae bacterium]|nr:hypothetical protein [Merismopediaceae bacterium]
MRRFLTLSLILLLSITTLACGNDNTPRSPVNRTTAPLQNQIASGRYPVQQATYNDSDGVYTLMLLNTPPGASPTYRTDKLQMARLTDEQIKQGETTSVEIKDGQSVMYLTEDFKIEYVHNVTELQENPQTGQREPVVIRQESSFWTPFAGALAGQALGSLLFRPQYYVPPVYSGGVMSGFGGYGNSYNQAVSSYRSRYNSPPAVEKNRQTLRTTGNLRKPSSGSSFGSKATRKPSYEGTKSSGSGFGSSRLRSSGSSNYSPRRSSSFGSSSGSRSRSFGSSRRR